MHKRLHRIAEIFALGIVMALPLPAQAFLLLPHSGNLTFEFIEGYGGTSLQEFGIGTPSESSALAEREVLFQVQLINESVGPISPSAVVDAGYFAAGTNLDFYVRGDFSGVAWALSSRLQGQPTFDDLEVFTDRNGSLGLGGSAIQQVSPTSWIFRLDAPNGGDDDDNELVIGVSLAPRTVPEPPMLSLLAIAFASIHLSARATKQTRKSCQPG